jgi:hypothetical protein
MAPFVVPISHLCKLIEQYFPLEEVYIYEVKLGVTIGDHSYFRFALRNPNRIPESGFYEINPDTLFLERSNRMPIILQESDMVSIDIRLLKDTSLVVDEHEINLNMTYFYVELLRSGSIVDSWYNLGICRLNEKFSFHHSENLADGSVRIHNHIKYLVSQ